MSDMPNVPVGAPDKAPVEVTQGEKDTLYSQLQMVDPNKEGITANMLRPFYPKAGWHIIFARLNALVADGKATLKRKGRPVPLEYYTWQ